MFPDFQNQLGNFVPDKILEKHSFLKGLTAESTTQKKIGL
jgi:hypothetical protein